MAEWKDGDRHEKLYEYSRAHWSRQNEEYIAKIICENKELIGDHPEIWIHGKVKS